MSIDNTGNNSNRPKSSSSNSSSKADLSMMINPSSMKFSNSFESYLQGANGQDYGHESNHFEEDHSRNQNSDERSSDDKEKNAYGRLRQSKSKKNNSSKTKKSSLGVDHSVKGIQKVNIRGDFRSSGSGSGLQDGFSKPLSYTNQKAFDAEQILQQMENLAPHKRALDAKALNYIVQQISLHVKKDQKKELFIRFDKMGGELSVRISQEEKGVKISFEGHPKILQDLENQEKILKEALQEKGGVNYLVEFT